MLGAREAAATPRTPDNDLTDLPFFTLDPPGSMDGSYTGTPRQASARFGLALSAAWVRAVQGSLNVGESCDGAFDKSRMVGARNTCA